MRPWLRPGEALSQNDAAVQTQLGQIQKVLSNINGSLDAGLRGPGLNAGLYR